MERLTSPNINVDPDTDRFLHAVIGGKEIDWKQSRDSTLNVLINGPTSNGFGKDIFRKMARDLYGRLKAYEDIAELCGGFDRLRELAEADKAGRCVVLPCKYWMDIVFGGQTLFWGIDTDYIENPIREIFVDDAERIGWYDGWKTVFLKGTDENGETWEFSPDEIGKTVFLTREEAAQALQEMEGKKDG